MTVTREDLENYQSLELLVQDLDDEIESMYDTRKSPSYNKTGATSSKSPGSPTERALRRIQYLESKRDELVQKQDEVINFVDTISDYLVRAIVRDHYLSGLTWEATSLHLKSYRSKSVLIDKVNRYFSDHGIE